MFQALKANLFLPLLLSAFLLIISCERNSTLKQTVTFKGYAYNGVVNSSGLLVPTAPAESAKVVCEGHPEFANTSRDGSYTLDVETVRHFTANDQDSYVLRAFNSNGGDEKITVSGKPGDVVNLRTFIFHKHTEEN